MQQETITPSVPPPHRDRSGGLVAFGILELLLAVACLFLAVTVLAAARMRLPNMPPSQANPVPAALTYLLAAVAFGWLGVGSILARRWACTLSQIAGWLWLVIGVIGGVFLLFFTPRMLVAMPGAQEGTQTFVIGCLAVFWGLFFVLLPLAFVLFYGSRNVRATCEARDPRPRWTDRCPAPVLALALMSAFAALSFVAYSVHPAFPVLGRVWTGAPGTVVFLVFAVLEAWIAWGLYRLRPAAWWGRLGLWLVSGGSAAFTFYRGVDWRQVLRASGQPDNPMTLRMLNGLFEGPYFLTLMAVVGVAFLGYLLWVKRYFVPRPAGA
jgi:hypothetical protein